MSHFSHELFRWSYASKILSLSLCLFPTPTYNVDIIIWLYLIRLLSELLRI